MSLSNLHRYPFVRLFIPLAIGIWCGDLLFFRLISSSGPIWFANICLFLIICMCGFIFRRYTMKWLFGVLVSALLFFCGIFVVEGYLQNVYTTYPVRESVYRIMVTSPPIIKKHSVQVGSRVVEIIDNGHSRAIEGQAILYFPKEILASRWERGDVVLVSTRLAPPVNSGNPDAFDYHRFLFRKGIGAMGYVGSGRWKKIGHIVDDSFANRALQYREKVLSIYRSFHWEEDVFSVVSALTVGYKDELSTDIRETYSVAGASHVLALSGLHIGFLYMLLLFLMKPMECTPTTRMIRSAIIVILLWGFAFFTGLSASVVRSVIMFSLFAVAHALKRESFSLNTLAAAAFFMLLIFPEWLFDVGFQLSFCAVASLLLFEPYLRQIIKTRTWVGKKLWQLITVTLAAQIGVAPLVLFYFSRFSVYFILSGLVVIPLVSVIMYVAVGLLACTFFVPLQNIVAIALQWMVRMLNDFLRWVEHLPWASWDNAYVFLPELIFSYLLLSILFMFLSSRNIKHLYVFLAGFVFMIGIHTYYYHSNMPRNSIDFYNIRTCPAVHCISSEKKSWLVIANSRSDSSDIGKIMSAHWNRLHLQNPILLKEEYANDKLLLQNSILTYGGVRIGIVGDNRWRYQRASHPLKMDFLYICHGFTGKVEELLSVFDVHKVIIDSSISDWRLQHLVAECRNRHISVISLRKGAFSISL